MRTPAAHLAALLLAGFGITGAGAVLAQRPPAAFEVASVKPRDPDNPRSMMVADASGRFTTMNIPVVMLIRTAYGLQNDQVIGGPDWMRSEGFNITAKAPDGTPVTAMGPMLESLLAERFQLTFHREKRELPVYALVTARSDGSLGPRMKPNPCVWDFTKPPGAAGPWPAAVRQRQRRVRPHDAERDAGSGVPAVPGAES